MTIIWCIVPKIWSMTDRIFCHSGLFFALLPPCELRKSIFWKNEKHTRRYYHFTNVHYKWQWYDVWFLRHGVQQTAFCHFGPFFAFLTLIIWKIKILKNEKKGLEILSIYTCVPTMTIRWCMVPEIWSMTDRIFLSFWTICCPFTSLTTQKIKILKNWKKHQEILSFYTCVPKITTTWCMVPEILSTTDKSFCHFGPFLPFYPPSPPPI